MAENAERTVATPITSQQPVPVTVQEQPRRSIEERIAASIAADAESIPQAPEPTPDAPPAETPEGEQQPEAPSEAPPEQPDAEPEKAAEGEAGEDVETVELETFDELAEYIGADKADLYNVQLNVTGPDGQPTRVSLGEIKDSYRAKEALDAELTAHAEAKSAFESQRAAQEAQIAEQLNTAAGLAGLVEQQLTADMQAINWQELRAEAPDEWAAKRQEFLDREAQLNQFKQQIQQTAEQRRAEAETQQANALAELKAREWKSLISHPLFTDWSDPEKARDGDARLSQYLADAGFTKEEIGMAYDHRVLALAEKARRYDDQSTKVDIAKKKVVKLKGKVLQPGSKQTRADVRGQETDALRERIRKSGKIDDVAAYIAATNRRG